MQKLASIQWCHVGHQGLALAKLVKPMKTFVQNIYTTATVKCASYQTVSTHMPNYPLHMQLHDFNVLSS